MQTSWECLSHAEENTSARAWATQSMSAAVFRVPSPMAGTPVLKSSINAFSASDPRVIDRLVTASITESRVIIVVKGI